VTTDVEREKFARIMAEINRAENQIEAIEWGAAAGSLSGDQAEKGELERLRERLTELMRELARISNACKKIHLSR
jgi:hypothetical protein